MLQRIGINGFRYIECISLVRVPGGKNGFNVLYFCILLAKRHGRFTTKFSLHWMEISKNCSLLHILFLGGLLWKIYLLPELKEQKKALIHTLCS